MTLATWFTPSLSTISRAKGRTATAAAAYRACTRIECERTGEVHDYKRKAGHVKTMLFGVPNMAQLWNAAEKAENRKNSVVARELMVPLPHDFTPEQRQFLTRALSQHLRTTYGVAVQASIHADDGNKNHHAHIMFTTRVVDEFGVFKEKTRVLDEGLKNGEIKRLREAVCDIVNTHAKKAKKEWTVYAGKFRDLDADHVPTMHIPINAPARVKEQMEADNERAIELRKVNAAVRVKEQELAQAMAHEAWLVEQEPQTAEDKVAALFDGPPYDAVKAQLAVVRQVRQRVERQGQSQFLKQLGISEKPDGDSGTGGTAPP